MADSVTRTLSTSGCRGAVGWAMGEPPARQAPGAVATAIRAAGFYIPDEGQIFFGDEDVTRLAPHKRNTGMMFQSYALWPHMTVAENVAFGLEERKVSKDDIKRRVGEALESVHMGAYAERKPN